LLAEMAREPIAGIRALYRDIAAQQSD